MSTSPSRTLPLLAPPPGAPIDEALAGRPEISVPEPPVARVVPRSNSIHGETRVDEYAWLRNREDPEGLAYLHAENRDTEAVLRPTEPLAERLLAERRGRL